MAQLTDDNGNPITGATSTYRLPGSAASTNAASVKAGPGLVLGIQGINTAAYPVYLCLYDTSGVPAPGTTPLRKKIPIPGDASNSVAFYLAFPAGLYFRKGVAVALVKLAADNDATALAAGDVVQLNLDYQ
jgi:hypothetical protein